jgi:hypothetical protein
MKNSKTLAIIFIILAIQSNLKSQISYSDNTISAAALFPSALGKSNTVNGNYALVGGINSFAFGEASLSIGNQAITNVEGNSAVALGMVVESNGPASFTLGRFLKSNAGAAFVLGSGYGSSGYLVNTIPSSLMIGFNSTVSTFFVSNSIGSTATGKIGIGDVTNPTAKLHLLSDDGEAAELLLEHRTTGFCQYAQISLGTHTIRAGNAENMVFTSAPNKHFAFMTGNLGIGTTEPVAKLQVTDGDIYIEDIDRGIIMRSPDGQCWRGKVSNNGTLEFNPVDCSNLTTATNPVEDVLGQFSVFPNPGNGSFTVEIPNGVKNPSVHIFASNGTCVLNKKLNSHRTTLNLSNFTKATYIVEFRANDAHLLSQKLIIK